MAKTRTPSTPTTGQLALDVRYLPLRDVLPNPDNVRHHLGDLGDLVQSVKAKGIEQPVTVYPHPDQPGKYLLLYGHRRRDAARIAKLATIPCVVRDAPDRVSMTEAMLVENLHRQDLNPVEEAQALRTLRDADPSRTMASIGAAVGRSQQWVSDRLAIVDGVTSPKVLELIEGGQVPVESAVQIARAKLTDKEQEQLARNGGAYVRSSLDQMKSKKRLADLRDKAKAEFGTVKKNRPDGGPWGMVRIGTSAGELNVPVGLHSSSCPGHAAVLDEYRAGWDSRASLKSLLSHYCTTPEEHKASEFVRGVPKPDGSIPYTRGRKGTPVAALAKAGKWPSGWTGGRHYMPDRYHAVCPHHAVVAVPWSSLGVAVCLDPGHHDDELTVEQMIEQYTPGTVYGSSTNYPFDDTGDALLAEYAAKLVADMGDTTALLVWALDVEDVHVPDDAAVDAEAAVVDMLGRCWRSVLDQHRPNVAQLTLVETLVGGPLSSWATDAVRERLTDARARFDKRVTDLLERRERAAALEAEAEARRRQGAEETGVLDDTAAG